MKKQLSIRRILMSVVAVLMLCLWASSIYAQEYALGDIPLDNKTYQDYMSVWADDEVDAIPASYDARNDGIVTSPKDQGSCGSCWAFASTGAYESHLLKQFGGNPTDLSEQQQVSCNTLMGGCCGGSSTALQFWETQGALQETCGSYGDGGTGCPTYTNVSCGTMSGCTQLPNLVTNFHTINNDPNQMKTSLYNDGPSYWRYDFYSDFNTFWNGAAPGTVYRNTGGSRQGGHAVLLIGWDDAKRAYLCKNSWGPTGGPNGDGTFWIAYTGHTNNLGFQMANFTLSGQALQGCTLDLNLGYAGSTLSMNFIISTEAAMTFNVWISFLNTIIPLGPIPLPALPSPTPISVPIPNFPQLGTIGVLTTINSTDGILCSDWEVVETGAIVADVENALDRLSGITGE